MATSTLKGFLGVVGLIDALNNIIEDFMFVDEVEYRAYMSKVGWVYDVTAFNNFVRYIGTTSTGYGKITQVWDMDDGLIRSDFQWRVTSQPSGTTRDNDELIDMTKDAYSGDVAYDGVCSTELNCVINYGGMKI